MANDSYISAGILVGYPYHEAIEMLAKANYVTGSPSFDELESDGLLELWYPIKDAPLEKCLIGVGVAITPVHSYEIIPSPTQLVELINETKIKLLEIYPNNIPKVYLTTFW